MRNTLRLLAVAICVLLLPLGSADAQEWKRQLDDKYKGKEGTLKVAVPRVKFDLISKNSKIIHVADEGVYYQSGTIKTHTVEDLQDQFTNRLGGKTADVQVLPAGTDVYIKKLHYQGDEIRVEFETEPFGADVIIDMGKDYKKRDAEWAVPYFESLVARAFSFGRLVELAEEHPEWDAELIARLDEGNIRLEMTPDMILYALGEPASKRRSITADGQRQEWQYPARDGMTIVFVDGVVAEIVFEE